MLMKSEIILKGMHFFAYHGLLPQEAVVGNEYVVTLTLSVDISKAMQTDNVHDTVNYAEVYQVVKVEMQQRSNLLEYVAGRIAHRILHDFPSLRCHILLCPMLSDQKALPAYPAIYSLSPY